MTTSAQPIYQQIKSHIKSQVSSGNWQVADRVPSESELVKQFNTSRMTANRALKELTDEGILERVAGVGTFVADRKIHGHPLKIRNIADEISERNHQHRAEVIRLEEILLSEKDTELLKLTNSKKVYHSVIVHYENNVPIQLEKRYVNPELAPDYLKQNFNEKTPYEYLIQIAPLQEVEHIVQAVMPDKHCQQHLKISADVPCLLIERRTWTENTQASYSELFHPGNIYELTSRFKP
jgi:GntR family histidine utilization transcriptional repressor